jgi:sulfur transfer protein SufE
MYRPQMQFAQLSALAITGAIASHIPTLYSNKTIHDNFLQRLSATRSRGTKSMMRAAAKRRNILRNKRK